MPNRTPCAASTLSNRDEEAANSAVAFLPPRRKEDVSLLPCPFSLIGNRGEGGREERNRGRQSSRYQPVILISSNFVFASLTLHNRKISKKSIRYPKPLSPSTHFLNPTIRETWACSGRGAAICVRVFSSVSHL